MSPQKCTYKENTLGLNMTRRIEGPCFFFFTRFSSYSSCGIPTNQSVEVISVLRSTLCGLVPFVWPVFKRKKQAPYQKQVLGGCMKDKREGHSVFH